jgi:hypothetical protein
MRTHIHIAFDFILILLLLKLNLIPLTLAGFLIMISAELIDIDHLFSRPIYHPKRNPFKTHFLHKNWLFLIIAAILMLFYKWTVFLGLGIISHLFLDLIYIKVYKVK